MWSWETNNRFVCWCKTNITPSPTLNSNRAAGPMPSTALGPIALGTARLRRSCATGLVPYPSASSSQTCVRVDGVNAWYGDEMGCAGTAPRHFPSGPCVRRVLIRAVPLCAGASSLCSRFQVECERRTALDSRRRLVRRRCILSDQRTHGLRRTLCPAPTLYGAVAIRG
jgi:hypothetical protein